MLCGNREEETYIERRTIKENNHAKQITVVKEDEQMNKKVKKEDNTWT